MHADDERASHIPAGLSVTGDLSSQRDLVIDGAFDGHINLPDQQLTISPGARVKGKVIARLVTIAGHFDGSVVASARVSLAETASVRAHLQTPSLALREGATFVGSVDPKAEAAMHVARYREKQAQG